MAMWRIGNRECAPAVAGRVPALYSCPAVQVILLYIYLSVGRPVGDPAWLADGPTACVRCEGRDFSCVSSAIPLSLSLHRRLAPSFPLEHFADLNWPTTYTIRSVSHATPMAVDNNVYGSRRQAVYCLRSRCQLLWQLIGGRSVNLRYLWHFVLQALLATGSHWYTLLSLNTSPLTSTQAEEARKGTHQLTYEGCW